MSIVQPTNFRFELPLGGRRWLEATYFAGRWLFERKGRAIAIEWPRIIARGLSRLPRFGGLTEYPYSVGRHSVLLSRYLRSISDAPRLQLYALFHDAPECLGLGDMNGRLKRGLITPMMASYDQQLIEFIWDELKLPTITEYEKEMVHREDKQFGLIESRILDMEVSGPWGEPSEERYRKFFSDCGAYSIVGLSDVDPNRTEDSWFHVFDALRKEVG